MSIDWPTVSSAIVSVVEDISGRRVQWLDEPRKFGDVRNQEDILVRVRQEVDDPSPIRRMVSLQHAAPASNLVEVIEGTKRVDFEFRLEGFRHERDRFAFNTMGKVRDHLKFMRHRAKLLAAGVVVFGVGPALGVPNQIRQSNRRLSVGQFDMFTKISYCAVDGTLPAEDGTGGTGHHNTIETVDPMPVDHPNTVIECKRN